MESLFIPKGLVQVAKFVGLVTLVTGLSPVACEQS